MLIARYLCRELVLSLSLILSVLLLITLSNMFVHYLSISAASEVFGSSVFKMIGMLLPGYLSLLLPISFFITILWVYGKLFADNELLVMFACGLTWRRLLKITLLPGIMIIMIVGACSMFVAPAMSAYQDSLNNQNSAQKNNLSLIKPGRITNIGQQVVYIGKSDVQKGTISDLFIYRNVDGTPQIILAPTGSQWLDPKTGADYILLNKGHEYKGQLNQLDYQIIKFDSYAQRLQEDVLPNQNNDLSAMTMHALWHKGDSHAWAEMEWRLSAPVAGLILIVLALSICYIPPRRGRFYKLFPAIMLFIIYFNLLSVSRSWVDHGSLAPWIGLWWVHLLFFAGAWLRLRYLDRTLLIQRWRRG